MIPDGAAGVRVSQISGARPGTLYPGVHLITPLIDSIAIYDTREQVYTTLASENPKLKGDVLDVQAREGLNIGLAVSVRYRLDPKRLDSIHTNLPQPVGEQVVAPVVSTIYRQLAPNYMTREVFATKREELRTKAAETITARLANAAQTRKGTRTTAPAKAIFFINPFLGSRGSEPPPPASTTRQARYTRSQCLARRVRGGCAALVTGRPLAPQHGPQRAPQRAYSTARDSRITVTLIWPGYSSSFSISLAISYESSVAASSSIAPGATITRISRPACIA